MATVSTNAYAKRRGVTPNAVRKAAAAGRIQRADDGSIDTEIADAALEATQAPARGGNGQSELLGGGKKPSKVRDNAEETYYEARARRERWQADQAELDYRESAGKLVDAEQVRASAFATARKARDLLTAIPDRIGAIVAGLDDAEECRKVIAEEIQRVCDELSGESPK